MQWCCARASRALQAVSRTIASASGKSRDTRLLACSHSCFVGLRRPRCACGGPHTLIRVARAGSFLVNHRRLCGFDQVFTSVVWLVHAGKIWMGVTGVVCGFSLDLAALKEAQQRCTLHRLQVTPAVA